MRNTTSKKNERIWPWSKKSLDVRVAARRQTDYFFVLMGGQTEEKG
jgi:hypothetical protein